jgi:hypothetical protein
MKKFFQYKVISFTLFAICSVSFAENLETIPELTRQEKIVLSNALIKTVDQTMESLNKEITEKELKNIEAQIEEQLNRNLKHEIGLGSAKILGSLSALVGAVKYGKHYYKDFKSPVIVWALASTAAGLAVLGTDDIENANKEDVLKKLSSLKAQLELKKRELENAEAAKKAIAPLADINSESVNH